MPKRLGRRNASEKFLTGDEVSAWRMSRQITQHELAKFLGLTAQAVAKYEVRGATRATALALSAIDRGLKPFQPTRADFSAVEKNKRSKSKREAINEKDST
jgi:transcriptional regulator with XRE-family HTH domain